jgi:hypothetical protein
VSAGDYGRRDPAFEKGTAKSYRLERFFELDIAADYWQSEHADCLLDAMMGTNPEVPS